MFTQFLIKHGFTRIDMTWIWCQAVGISTLIIANVANLSANFAYIGIPLTELDIHRISVAAAVVLYVGGKYSTSPLPKDAAK